MAGFFKRSDSAATEDMQLNTSLQAQLAELNLQDQNDELQAIIEEKELANARAKECREKVREFFKTTDNVRAKLITVTPQVNRVVELIRSTTAMQVSSGTDAGKAAEAGISMVSAVWDAIIGDGENGGGTYFDLLKILSVVYGKESEDLRYLPPTELYQMAATIFNNPMFAVFFPRSRRLIPKMPFGT
jgi:hypothetical protein